MIGIDGCFLLQFLTVGLLYWRKETKMKELVSHLVQQSADFYYTASDLDVIFVYGVSSA